MANTYRNTSDQIVNSLSKVMAIRSMIKGDELTKDEIYTLKGMQVVDSFLNAPINSSEEIKLKKVFVAAVIAAKEFGNINLGGIYTPEEISIAVSEGLTRLKNQYRVGKNDGFEESDAREVELDHMMAALAVEIEIQIDKWCKRLPDKLEELTDEHYDKLVTTLTLAISTKITIVLGPDIATTVTPFIHRFLLGLKPKVQELVKKGAEAILKYVKSEIQEAVKQGLVVIQKVKNWVQKNISLNVERAGVDEDDEKAEDEEEYEEE